MRKKLFSLFCCAALLFAGCGGSAEPAEDAHIEDVVYGTNAASFNTTAAGATMTEAVTENPGRNDGMASQPAPAEGIPENDLKADDEIAVDYGIHYFTFRTDTKIYQNQDGQDLLRETFTDPGFYNADTQLSDWVNAVLDGFVKSEQKLGADLLDYAEEELERIGEEFYTFSHYLTMGVGRHDSRIVSVMGLSSMYSGGPHPSTVQTALNLDLNTQTVLTLEEVIQENADGILLDRVRTAVLEKFALVGEEGFYPDYQQVLKNELTYGNMTPHWYFNENGLVIFFNQYVLAPYAAGIIKAELPYDTLEQVLRPEFMPESYSGTADGVRVSKTDPGTGTVYSISFGAGDTVYIQPEGKASHVQLSQVYFAEDIPVGESMLFSANYLDESVVIALQGDWKDEKTIYGVEYSDESGGANVLYSTSAQVWDSLS